MKWFSVNPTYYVSVGDVAMALCTLAVRWKICFSPAVKRFACVAMFFWQRFLFMAITKWSNFWHTAVWHFQWEV